MKIFNIVVFHYFHIFITFYISIYIYIYIYINKNIFINNNLNKLLDRIIFIFKKDNY